MPKLLSATITPFGTPAVLVLLNQTLVPYLVYYQDRLPTGQGNGSFEFPISNSSGFVKFVEQARIGWRSYDFDVLYQFSAEDRVAV